MVKGYLGPGLGFCWAWPFFEAIWAQLALDLGGLTPRLSSVEKASHSGHIFGSAIKRDDQ
jgi:hypothetical protein